MDPRKSTDTIPTPDLPGSLKLVQRNALVMLPIAVFAFLFFTALPVTRDVFTRSKVFISADGVKIESRSLILSEPGILAFHSTPFRRGHFSLELVIQPRNLNAVGPARIVAFSTDTKRQNWVIGQVASTLVIRHRGRELRFNNVLTTNELQHFLFVLGRDGVTLYRAGEGIAKRRWKGSQRSWDENARLTIGNEVTGDRPWTGVISQFRLYDKPLSAADAASLSRRGYIEEPTVSLLPNSAGRLLTLHTSVGAQDLTTYSWPFVNKIDQVLSTEYQISTTNLLDVTQNIILGLPIGLLIFALLGKIRTSALLLLAISFQFLLSFLVELLQLGSFYRVASPVDVISNVFGAALGGILWRFAVRKYAED